MHCLQNNPLFVWLVAKFSDGVGVSDDGDVLSGDGSGVSGDGGDMSALFAK